MLLITFVTCVTFMKYVKIVVTFVKKCYMSYFHIKSLDRSMKWWISMDWPVNIFVTFFKKNVTFVNNMNNIMLHFTFPFQFPGLVGEMVNPVWLANEKSCSLWKMKHIWKKCNLPYFHFNSLDWPVKWCVSRDWPVKICENSCYICEKNVLHMLHMLHVIFPYQFPGLAGEMVNF